MTVRDMDILLYRYEADGNSSDEPVVFVTGNRYFPAIRSYPQAEAIWEEDGPTSCDMFVTLVEIVEALVNEAGVALESPDYDNRLYVVDTRRFEFLEEDTEAENLSDEWRLIKVEGK